jgi:hypothetical protein
VRRRTTGWALLLLLCCAAWRSSVGGGDRVVLIMGRANPAVTLDAIDIKRLFLGIPVQRGAASLHALINESDPGLKQVFLQYVVSMSESGYQRRLLMLGLEQGRHLPRAYRENDRLLSAVAADGTAVSYAWESSLRGHPGIRVLRELWHD